jgi:DNA-binding NarL/FixJ family response regulator
MKNGHSFSLVAERNQFFAAGIEAILREHPAIGMVSLVSRIDQLQEALNSCAAVDLLLIDEAFLKGEANIAVATLVEAHPNMSIIILLEHIDAFKINGLIAAGAIGIIHKSSSKAELHGAVSMALSGHSYIATTDSSPTPVRHRTSANLPSENGLTARQNQIIALVASGASNKEIARKLGITESTVKVHMATIFKRFGVHNRTSAVALMKS